jgi:hypothetical protein
VLRRSQTLERFEATLREEPVDHAERLRHFDLLLAEARALACIISPHRWEKSKEGSRAPGTNRASQALAEMRRDCT